ncbi:MAG: CsbD family protein [bacterium]|nr:CsbD family protein [bacterium]
MEKLTFTGTWLEVSGKLKQKFGHLTDNDLLFLEGKEEELLGRLQVRLGRTKSQLRSIIKKI